MTERKPRPMVQLPARWLGWLLGWATALALVVVVLSLVLVHDLHGCAL